MSNYSIDEARMLLLFAGIFYDDDITEESPELKQVINLNDTFYWACSDCQRVTDDELPRIAELFWRYGWCGVLYWVLVEKRKENLVEFADVNRFIEFVAQEEKIRVDEPSQSRRAYMRRQYTIGKEASGDDQLR